MKVGYKVWIEDKNKAFGKGPYELLIQINKLGSINMACKNLNMSYSKGLKIINNIENELKLKLLDRTIGGRSGGGCSLTEDAKILIHAYEKFTEELDIEMNRLFKKYFDNII
ncbi:winged helix-turn-helix domain-containing protein [Senegalia massiliensis]|uniref:winged helix-turn-helix domain-containing protein n=1 Tax=Senegalia massiliensis TaxID=1720316 RepID=UPI001030ADEB|nr:LysR family transcriptional regulator [Senegalia massiliensis]